MTTIRLAIILVSFQIISLNKDRSSCPSTNCLETENLINRIVAAKVVCERSYYWKEERRSNLKLDYSNLVKKFKQTENFNLYDNCIHKLITKDSISSQKKVINFSYQPPHQSKIEKCTYLDYLDFLKIMLANLHDTKNVSTIVCEF
jgi:hypothetical protein